MKNSGMILLLAVFGLMLFTACNDPTDTTGNGGDTFTVTFVSNGGTYVAPQTVAKNEKAVEPQGVTRDKHFLVGWFRNEGLTAAYNFFINSVTEDITLYAKWEELFPFPDNPTGTGSGSASGYGGTVTVTITMTDGWITDVVILGPGETAAHGQIVIQQALVSIKEKNSVEIDVVSGVTRTCNAIIEAGNKAIDAISNP